MTTIEQARAVEQQLRRYGYSEIQHEAADTIAALITELEAALCQAVDALEWYVEEDDVIESMESKRAAKSAITAAKEVLK